MTQSKVHYCRNPSSGLSNLILHKTEWDRITRQTKPQENRLEQENKYLQALIEQSRAWMKNWPDTVEVRNDQLQHSQFIIVIYSPYHGS